jgi:hypothetical protein
LILVAESKGFPPSEAETKSKMARDDRDYFDRRAEAEIALAQRATHSSVVRAHYELASAYLDLIYGETQRPAEQTA